MDELVEDFGDIGDLELNERYSIFSELKHHPRHRFEQNNLSMKVDGSSAQVFFWCLLGPFDELKNDRTKLILVQLNHELLKGLYHGCLHQVKLEYIDFVVRAIVDLWEVEYLLEERADLLEVLAAEFFLHRDHHGLQKMLKEPQGYERQMCLELQTFGTILNQYLVKAIANSLEKLLEAYVLWTILADDLEDRFDLSLEDLVDDENILQYGLELRSIEELGEHGDDRQAGLEGCFGE